MTDKNKIVKESTAPKGNIAIGILITIIVIAIFGGIALYQMGVFNQKATNNDIDGDWNSTLTTHSYVFIPKSNIHGLEFTFSIRDKDGKELQQIVKKVGDVKKDSSIRYRLTLPNYKTLQR